MRPPTAAMPLTSSKRDVLERLARSRTAAHGEVQRARALLLPPRASPTPGSLSRWACRRPRSRPGGIVSPVRGW